MQSWLAGHGSHSHAPAMFCVTEAQAVTIRAAFEQSGELSAVAELRRLFPGLGNVAWARECVRDGFVRDSRACGWWSMAGRSEVRPRDVFHHLPAFLVSPLALV